MSQYFDRDKQGILIGWFTSLNTLFSALIYLWCIYFMPNVPGVMTYFRFTNMMLFYATLIFTLVFIAYLLLTSVSEWDTKMSNVVQTSMKNDNTNKQFRFWGYFFIYGALTATSGILENILEQILATYNLSVNASFVAALLFMFPSVITTILAGWCYDYMQKNKYKTWILPLIITLGQCVAQIGIFYFATTTTALLFWITLFGILNGSLTVVFLPTLLNMYDSHLRPQIEEQVNQRLLLWSTFCICTSVFILCWPSSNVLIFGTYMIGTAVACFVVFGLSFFF